MSTVYFTKADVSAGVTITKSLDTGSYCAIKFSNMSPYPLVTHTQQSYNHDTYFSDMLDIIQPWTITPLHVQEYPVVCYITMDTGFAPVNTTDATLLSMQGVTGRSYQSPLPSYTPIDLLSRTQTNITNTNIPVSGSVNANITNATIDANSTIVNELLSVGPSVRILQALTTGATYDAGTQYQINIPIPNGSYNGIFCSILSPGGFSSYLNNSDFLFVLITDASNGYVGQGISNTPFTLINFGSPYTVNGKQIPFYKSPQVGNILRIAFTPSTTFTDNLTIVSYLIYDNLPIEGTLVSSGLFTKKTVALPNQAYAASTNYTVSIPVPPGVYGSIYVGAYSPGGFAGDITLSTWVSILESSLPNGAGTTVALAISNGGSASASYYKVGYVPGPSAQTDQFFPGDTIVVEWTASVAFTDALTFVVYAMTASIV